MLELAQREPTNEEMLLITPCLPDEQAADPVVAEIEPAKAPEPVLQEVLVAPEGVPWYDGPLFDTHMHLISLTNPFYGRLVTTAEVTLLMNRHNVQAAIGFYLTPVIGRQVEVDALLQAVKDLDDRIVTLLMPPPFDFGFPFGFMGFSAGTYTRALLEPWYPPYGTFDGFGEIPFYVDNLNSIDPLDSQLDAVYPLVAESKGVVMIHPDQSQSTESYAEVMRRYPEITFLYHGSKDFHGTENHRKVIIELLETYEGDNFYYTVDSGSILHENSLEEGSSIQMDSDSSEQFVELMNRFGVQNLAQHAYDEVSDVIIGNPDLLMWGTDILPSWHFDDAGADLIIDFSRRFIGLLPEEIQEKFAYGNAARVFGRYLDD